MALEEVIEYDKIEIVGQYKHVQVRKASVIGNSNQNSTFVSFIRLGDT